MNFLETLSFLWDMFNFPGCNVTSQAFQGIFVQHDPKIYCTADDNSEDHCWLTIGCWSFSRWIVFFFCHVWCVCWVKGVLLNVEGRSLSRNTWPYCSCYTSIVDPPYSMPNKTGGSPAVLLDIESSGRIQQTKPQEVQYLDVWDTVDGSEIPNNHLEWLKPCK